MSDVIYTAHKQSGILLNANECSSNLKDEILKEIQEAIPSIAFNRYPDDECTELLEAYGKVMNLSPDKLLAGNGSDAMLALVISTFLKGGKTGVTLSPDFGMYDYYCSSYGAKLLKYDTDQKGDFDLDGFISFAKENDAALVLFSNPNNPSGHFVDNARIKKLCESLPECAVVMDEAYVEFSYESALDLIDTCPNLYVTRTLSKAYSLAGVRLGFLISSKENMDKIKPLHVTYSVNSVSQKIGCIVLKHAAYFQKEVENTRLRRDELLKKSYKNIYLDPSQGNFIRVRAKNLDALLKKFNDNNITIRTYNGKDYCRVTVGSEEEIQLVEKVFDQYEKEVS